MRLPKTIQLDQADSFLQKLRRDDERFGHSDDLGPAFTSLGRKLNQQGGLGLTTVDTTGGTITIGSYLPEGGDKERFSTSWLHLAETLNKVGLLLARAQRTRLMANLKREKGRKSDISEEVVASYRKAIEALTDVTDSEVKNDKPMRR